MYLLVPRGELRPISCPETDISYHFRVTKRVFLWTQEGWGITKAFVRFHLFGENHLSLSHSAQVELHADIRQAPEIKITKRWWLTFLLEVAWMN